LRLRLKLERVFVDLTNSGRPIRTVGPATERGRMEKSHYLKITTVKYAFNYPVSRMYSIVLLRITINSKNNAGIIRFRDFAVYNTVKP